MVDIKLENAGQGHQQNYLKLKINGEMYEWNEQYITGLEIKQIGSISSEDDIYLAVKKPWDDELINNDTRVDLARPEVEHFFSEKKEKTYTIIVAGTPKQWDNSRIKFEDVIVLAYGSYIDNPTMVYTVAYEDGPRRNPEGSMIKGSKVFIKNQMIFHVTATDKS